MCVQLEFTIHRGTHLCPPTPLAHTREESRTLRSRIVNTTLEMSLEVECHWCLGMGEEGEEPRDRTSPPQLRPISLQPFARVERPRARFRGKRGKSREIGLRRHSFAPLVSSPSLGWRGQEPEPRARAKSLRSIASRSQSRRFVLHTHTYSLTHIHAHAHTLVYSYFETYKWCGIFCVGAVVDDSFDHTLHCTHLSMASSGIHIVVVVDPPHIHIHAHARTLSCSSDVVFSVSLLLFTHIRTHTHTHSHTHTKHTHSIGTLRHTGDVVLVSLLQVSLLLNRTLLSSHRLQIYLLLSQGLQNYVHVLFILVWF